MKSLTPILLFVASIGLLYLFVKPHYENIGALRAQTSQYDDAIARADEVAAKRNDLLNKRNAFNPEDVKRLQKLLPDTIDNIRLIIDINTLAAHYGASLKNIGITTQNVQKQDAVGPDVRPYGTMTLSFGVSMSYESMQKFLVDLERSLRLVDVSSLSFKPSDTSNVYDFSVGLTTYWLK